MKSEHSAYLFEHRLKHVISRVLNRARFVTYQSLPSGLVSKLHKKAIYIQAVNTSVKTTDSKTVLKSILTNEGIWLPFYLPSTKQVRNAIWSIRRPRRRDYKSGLFWLRTIFNGEIKGLVVECSYANDELVTSWHREPDALAPLPPPHSKTELGESYFIPLDTIEKILHALEPLKRLHKLRLKILALENEYDRMIDRRLYEKANKENHAKIKLLTLTKS